MPLSPSARAVIRTALLDLLLLAVLVTAGELGLRLFYPAARRHVYSQTLTGGHPILMNSHGLRDVEFPADPPAGQRRILCLGDSTTFGAGIAAEETYPKQLEQLLNAESGDQNWLVINGGGQGASISDLAKFMREKGLAFRPERVTLAFSPTMVGAAGQGESSAAAPAAPETLSRRLHGALMSVHVKLHASYLYVLTDALLRGGLYRMGVLRDRMDHPHGAQIAYAFDVPGIDRQQVEQSYGVLEAELAQLKQQLEEEKIPLAVLIIPSRFRISDSPRDNERGYDLKKIRIEPTDRVAEMCLKLGIPFVDLRKALGERRQAMLRKELPWDNLYVPGDYAHLNPAGMRVAAEELRRETVLLVE